MDDNDKSSGVFDSNGLLSKQDIKALRSAKKAMKKIEEGNASVNYNSLFEMIMTSNQNKRN